MSFKLDLHTHSNASYDGGLSTKQYRRALKSGVIDCVAVTDHNRIDFAQSLFQELGDRIIVGEEVKTTTGEIIGLFLNRPIPSGLTPLETVKQIKAQGGIVYIPHPFETIRKGLKEAELDQLKPYIDLVEVNNGRTLAQNFSKKATDWALRQALPGAAGSDAHGFKGLGRTYVNVASVPTRKNFIELIRSGSIISRRAGARALLYPKYHRLRKKFGGSK